MTYYHYCIMKKVNLIGENVWWVKNVRISEEKCIIEYYSTLLFYVGICFVLDCDNNLFYLTMLYYITYML